MERKSARSRPRMLVYADRPGPLRPISATKEKDVSKSPEIIEYQLHCYADCY